MMRAQHITFANHRFAWSAIGLQRSVRRWGLSSRLYTPLSAPVRQLQREHPEIMSARRGAGYWLWKSHIILDALNRARDGDIILYTDAGTSMVADPWPLLRLLESGDPIMLFEPARHEDGSASLPLSDWTKRDCFVVLDADGPAYWTRQQLSSGFQAYRAGQRSRDFVAAWAAACRDSRLLTDQPNVMGLPNLPGFRDHRHDQAILSILAAKADLPLYPDPSQYGHHVQGASYGQILDLHRRSSPLLSFARRLLRPLRNRFRKK